MAARPLWNGSARVSVDNNPADPALLFRYTFKAKVGAAPVVGDENIDNTTFQVRAGTALTIFYDLRKFGAGVESESPSQATIAVLRDDGVIEQTEALNLGPGLPVTGSFSFTPANPGTYWLRLFMRSANPTGGDFWSANNDELFVRIAVSAITRRFTADKARIRAGGVLNSLTITERGNAAPAKFAPTMKADESDVEEAVRFDPAWAANPLTLSGNTLRRKNRRNGTTTIDSSTALFGAGVNDFAVHLLNFPAGERSYDAVFECDVNSSIHNGNTPQYSGLAAQEASGAWMHFEAPGVGLTLEDFKTVAKLNTFTLDSTTTLPSIFFNNTADYSENASGVPQGAEDFSFIATAENIQGKAGGLKNSRNELLKGVFVFCEVTHEQSGAVRDSWGLDNASFKTNAAGWSTASRVVTVSTPPSGVHKITAQTYFPVSSLGNAAIRKLLATRTEGGSPAGADAGKDWIAPANFTASIVIFKSPTKGGELNVVTIKVYDKALLKDADFDPPVKVYKNGSPTLWASLVVTKRPGVSGVYDVFLTSDAVAAGESDFYEIAAEVTLGGFLKVFGATLTAIPFDLPSHGHRAGDGSKFIEVPEMDKDGNPLF